MGFEKIIEAVKEKRIYEIFCSRSNENKEYLLFLNMGKPLLIINSRRKSGDHAFKHFKDYVIDQEHYITNIESEVNITILGYWELKYKDKILLNAKSDVNKIEEIYNFILQGHKIINIELLDDGNIKITFSNKMNLNIRDTQNIDGLFVIYCGDKAFGISNKVGIIGKSKLDDKVLKFLNYYHDIGKKSNNET